MFYTFKEADLSIFLLKFIPKNKKKIHTLNYFGSKNQNFASYKTKKSLQPLKI